MAEFQRVLAALSRGAPDVGADDVTAAVDGLAGHLGPDEIAAMRVVAELFTAYQHRDVAAVTAMPARLAGMLAGLPAGSPLRPYVESLAQLVDVMAANITRPRGGRFVAPTLDGPLSPSIQEALRVLAAGGLPPAKVMNKLRRDAVRLDLSPVHRAYLFALVGMMSSGHGNAALEWLAVRDFRMAVRHAGPGDPQRPHYLLVLADALLNRAWATAQARGPIGRFLTRLSLRPAAGALRDAAEGIALLEQARDLAGWPGQAHWALICVRLGLGYRMVGRHADARAVGTAGLRGHMWQVLMQAHTAAAATSVTWAVVDALEVAGWHADDGDPDGAAAALEAGRALVLHAATETRDVPEQLAAAGHGELAERWRALPDGLEAKPAPLRRTVFERLVEPRRLLDPPTGEEVRAALRAVNADALVYLVPADEQVGHAVIVPAQGRATIVPLPDLTAPPHDPVEVPHSRDLAAMTRDDGDWAWTAAIGPLLDGPFAGREPRLVLISMGGLGAVAWHAAKSGQTWAIERATFSYAPSARMLCAAAAADTGSHGPALIVGDPDTGGAADDLPAARFEALAVRERFFPGARYLGRPWNSADGAGTTAEIEEWLADAGETGGVLHLACHAGVSDDQAYLLLAGGEKLSADRLAGATRNGRRPGLVVLAACRSAVSGRSADEAFSLAATFLSAGAGTVVAAQWSLPDQATSEVMLRFHEHVAAGARPADALRRAQLASLDLPVTDWAGLIHFGR